ncbi:hypothetical protein [Paenibacillus sp. IHBB 10380]|uniref:hypothetical protein n=1 Tax=Paenibacillus sp. IHBB 10380 TaxID=1566358 RepID=UPI0005CFE88A|nr:hypothetical protein [Paenibacillus sp. IHBB 10380]AJS59500.1 hypothetical protein UB51_14680 [Paenibacillus sp. IHBB 10380]
MPNIVDSTVIAGAHDISGNGGRKLVRLSNGVLFSAVKSGSSATIYKSKDNGLTWVHFKSNASVLVQDVALETNGINIYVVYTMNNDYVGMYAYTETGVNLTGPNNVDTRQTALGNISLAINSAGTELHAAWASKNATYANSFNIRYVKGTINASTGAVTWGGVEQQFMFNSTGYDIKNPTITVLSSGYPLIITERLANNGNGITYNAYNGSSWSSSNHPVSGGIYPQTSISSTFVPQSINGLVNGLVGMAWHGKDSTSAGVDFIRFSKSTDGAKSWSTMQRIVVGTNPSLSSNRSGKLLITYQDATGVRVIESENDGETWSSPTAPAAGTNPSSLVDLTMDVSEPLTIRKGASSVLFSGSWIETTNSIPSGFIGAKDNKSNLLTYAITTDGAMSTITEKVNGVVVGTKTATSGQNLTVGLTQAQWDAVKYGKYKGTSSGLNTLTVEMGSNIWTYTFDKRLAATDDVLSAVKATQDTQTTFLPAVKSRLGEAIRSKGGTVSSADSWDAMINAVGALPEGAKYAEGTVTVIQLPSSYSYISIPFTSWEVKTLIMWSDALLRFHFARVVNGTRTGPWIQVLSNGTGTNGGSTFKSNLNPDNLNFVYSDFGAGNGGQVWNYILLNR